MLDLCIFLSWFRQDDLEKAILWIVDSHFNWKQCSEVKKVFKKYFSNKHAVFCLLIFFLLCQWKRFQAKPQQNHQFLISEQQTVVALLNESCFIKQIIQWPTHKDTCHKKINFTPCTWLPYFKMSILFKICTLATIYNCRKYRRALQYNFQAHTVGGHRTWHKTAAATAWVFRCLIQRKRWA